MPFSDRSVQREREEFCRLAGVPGSNVRELCRRFGVSPTTGYKWLAIFAEAGSAGLEDRSRRPLSSPRRTTAELEGKVLQVRTEHRAWGGRKIRRVLQNEEVASVPAASTITAILRRHGELDGPGAGEPRSFRRFEHAAPNDLWQMDFKGWVELEAGRCHPLTVLDDHSRYALELEACADETAPTVKARLTAVFKHYGLPWRMLADNGPPWGTAGQGQYTRLGVWLMDLGFGLVHGRPYHPQTQGKDERFHRTLKAEVLDARHLRSLAEAQAAFDAWRAIYNNKRPHEALRLNTPASRYEMSSRSMPEVITPPQYEPQDHVRKLDQNGRFSFKGRILKTSTAFAGRSLALRATDTDGLFDICYRRHRIAQIDMRDNAAQPVHHVPEHPSTLSPV
ncbi:IS481 family transposase [Devosia sp. A16]|uniref:IS481 family transposase n=1 Tax=Devosia sp. A16 TaxID=1736675 RepID=UPI0006D7AE26|nr:IS481 family transposase [Devosia sp. A16]